MAKHSNRTTEIIRETDSTFLAHLDNGGMRFGIKGMASRDVSRFHLPDQLLSVDDDDFDDYVSSLFATQRAPS